MNSVYNILPENIVLIKLDYIIPDLVDELSYDIIFNINYKIIFPGPRYLIDDDGNKIDYYMDSINKFNNMLIPMKFRGYARIDGLPMFELNIISVMREIKLKELFG